MNIATRLLTVAALGVVLGATSLSHAAAPPYTFHAAEVLPGSDDGSEPSIAISTSGVRYASWQAPGEFASSADGVTWHNLGTPEDDAVGDVTNAVDAAGALYNGQLCGSPQDDLHTCIWRSLDGGKTWPQKADIADNHPGASDRPWIEVYPHTANGAWNPDQTTVYLEYHTFSPEELVYVTVSTDGGKTFSTPKIVESDTNAIVGSGCNTIPGGVAVDDSTGNVYVAWLSGEDVVQNAATGCNYSEIGPFTKAWVSASTDHGATWTSHLVWHGAYDRTTNVGDGASHQFPTIAVDRGGQVHVMLGVRRHDDPVGFVLSCQQSRIAGECSQDPQPTDLLLLTSPDGGQNWTPEFKVNSAHGSYFMPWIAAGSKGIVDAVYYRSDSLTPDLKTAQWHIASAQVTGAVAVVAGAEAKYTSPPVVSEVLLEPGIVHTGGICAFGLFCAIVPDANRNLADSIAIALDPEGGANAVWTDDPGGKRKVMIACQNGGASAFSGRAALAGCAYPLAAKRSAPSKVLGIHATRPRTLASTGVEDRYALSISLIALAIAIGVRRWSATRR